VKDDPRQHEGSERTTIQRVCHSLLMEVGHAAGSQAHHAMTAIVAYIECFYKPPAKPFKAFLSIPAAFQENLIRAQAA
jgi:hypothetical protein